MKHFVLILLILAAPLFACTPSSVVRKEPEVRFTKPEAALLYIRARGGVLRIKFNGKKRLAPFTCDVSEATVHTAESTKSLLHSLKIMSQQSGFSRVQLMDTDGSLLARGSFCIFPTLKTANKAIKHQYIIELPPKVMKRLRSGKPVAVFQDYVPLERAKPGWNHLAWVLYLEHHTMQ